MAATRVIAEPACLLALFVLAGCGLSRQQAVQDVNRDLQLRLVFDRSEFRIGEQIPAKVIYTNVTGKPLTLYASGTGAGSGFSGEIFTVTAGRTRTVYRSRGVDPAVEEHRIDPGQSWQHAIPDLRSALRASFRDDRSAADRDPFGTPGRYQVGLSYDSDLRSASGDRFVGRAEAEAVEVVLTAEKGR